MRSLVIPIFLYACESWTLTAELEKRTQVFEMRYYRRLLNISYKDHVTNEEPRGKIRAAIGGYDELLIKVVWVCLKVFWFGKDNSIGHSEWKKEEEVDRRRGRKTIL